MQTSTPLNWARITQYAVLMFLVHFSVGLLEGVLTSGVADRETMIRQMVIGLGAILLLDLALFARLAYRQRERRMQHAAVVFLLMLGIAQVFDAVISLALPSGQPALLAVLELSVSALGLLSGTWLGYVASLRRGGKLDAC